MIIDGGSLIKKYESGEAMTPDEKELLLASLYFVYRQHSHKDLAGAVTSPKISGEVHAEGKAPAGEEKR